MHNGLPGDDDVCARARRKFSAVIIITPRIAADANANSPWNRRQRGAAAAAAAVYVRDAIRDEREYGYWMEE